MNLLSYRINTFSQGNIFEKIFFRLWDCYYFQKNKYKRIDNDPDLIDGEFKDYMKDKCLILMSAYLRVLSEIKDIDGENKNIIEQELDEINKYN